MTKIPYLDEMWSVTTGCGDDMVSLGCEHCYARRMFGRNLWKCPQCHELGEVHQVSKADPSAVWTFDCDACRGTGKATFTPTFHADRLDQPLHWRKPRRIGVSFMGDLFHEEITTDEINCALSIVDRCPQHTFFILTKRPERMRKVITGDPHLPNTTAANLWPGVTVCNQAEADRNIPILLDTPAAVRGVSLEPMLGAVQFKPSWILGYDFSGGRTIMSPRIDWVVLGGETGPGARPMDPIWALDVYRQCKAAGVPFWFKQWGPGKADHRQSLYGPDLLDMGTTHELPAVAP